MGNYSRDPKTELNTAQGLGYVRVRFQQGKPMLDREMNLAADLAGAQLLFSGYVGNGIAAGTNGFAISNLNVATNDFTIAAGRALVGGLEAVLAADTAYRTQPVTASVAPIPAGASNVYLHVSTREVNSAEDPALANPADVTFETSVRDKVVWEVLVSVSPIARADHLLLAVINTVGPVVTEQRRISLNTAALRDDLTGLGQRVNASVDAAGALRAGTSGLGQLRTQSIGIDGALNGSSSVVLDLFIGNEKAPLLVNVFPTKNPGAVSWSQSARQAVVNGQSTVIRSVQVHNDIILPITFRCEALLLLV